MEFTNYTFRVLVVDDTPKNIQLLLTILSRKTYEIHVANNGIQALRKAQMVIPDLILLDVMMPEMDGFETCRQLKSNPDTENIPVIFLTARTETEDIVKGFELGAVDYITKPFNSAELLARVHTHLELKRKENIIHESYQVIRGYQNRIKAELEQARATQHSLLPEQFPQIHNAGLAVKYILMEEIGGDFYDVFELTENQFGLMVADVTGHGVSAALLSFMFSSFFSHARHSGTSTDVTMRLTNSYIENRVEEGKFATMFYVIYNSSTQQLTYSSAGHPPGLLIRPSTSEIIELNTSGLLLGCWPTEMWNYEEKTIQMVTGDKLLLYTDGIIEVLNEQGEMLGVSGLKSFLLQNKNSTIEDLLDQLCEFGTEFSECHGFTDDLTILGLEIS